MNTRKFLELVWPPSGPYCIATPWKGGMAHYGGDTIKDVLGYLLRNKSKDLYFAPHALKVICELNPKTGKLQTFRTQENIREGRDFFFDIDVGPDKRTGEIHYATQDDVLSALEKFLFETCLPSPFVINSGYGIHVHWIIDTPIESVAWKEPASRLRWLAQKHGLHIDPSKVVDQASVLRVPGTFNYKDRGAPRPVALIAEGVVTNTAKFLEQLNDLTPADVGTHLNASRKSNKTPSLEVAWDGRQPPADEVADVCEHMRAFRDSQGNVSEPAWHVGIGTIKHCEDGEATAHKWSSGYPNYTEAETQKKLDLWTKPPPGCDKISANSGDPAICARCPHKDVAKNPLLIANLVYEKTHQPAIPELPCALPCDPPRGYTLDPVHGIKLKGEGVICSYLMFPVELVEATRNEEGLSRWQVKYPRKGWKKIEIPNSALDGRKLINTLCDKGIILLPGQGALVHMFMRAYLKDLQKYQDDLSQFDYLGWETPVRQLTETTPVELENPKWFIHYGRKISVATGSVVPCVMTRNTQFEGMGRAGSMDEQIKLMEFYNAPEYMAQQFIIGASLATPFFTYSTLHGMLICLTGDTGASKSTGLYAASSLWGHPKLFGVSGLRSKGTDKGRQEREVVCANLPFMVDEITRYDKETAHEIALAATQPGPYVSLKNNRDFRQGRGGYKSNLTICTSNVSLTELVNADSSGGQAGVMRVFEIKVERNIIHSKTEADNLMRALVENYGWIGEAFLCRCLPQIDKVKNEFLKIQQRLERDINASQEERYITACCAAALLGIKLGSQEGYLPFSYRAMRDWLINVQIPAMRNAAKLERERSAPETILYEYLETINQNICRVNKNIRKETEVIYAPPHVEFKARYEIHNTKVFVRLGSFKEHCADRRHNCNSILDQLEKDGVVIHKRIQKRMREEKGTLSNPVMCFVVRVPATSPVAVKLSAPPEDDNLTIVDFSKKSKP